MGLLTLLLVATAPKLLLLPLELGEGVSKENGRSLGDAFAGELRRQSGYELLTQNELEQLLGHEAQKQMLGCSDDACRAKLGDAARADRLGLGQLGKVGKSWLVSFEILEVKDAKVLASASRRIDGELGAVLDAIPVLVSEVVERSGVRKDGVEPAPPAVVGAEMPKAWQEVPYEVPDVRGRLSFATDGAGHYLGFDPKARYEGAFFAGGEAAIYAQRLSGGGASGADWSAVFWEPRVKERWRGGFELKGGAITLQCGDKAIPFKALSAGDAKKYGAKVELRAIRWTRTARYLARDDRGEYWFVDQALAPEDNHDFRLFIGPKGALESVPIGDAIVDPGSSVFVTKRGRLIVSETERNTLEARWAVGDAERRLTVLDLWAQAPMIYRELGPYRGQSLGTPCDPWLQP